MLIFSKLRMLRSSNFTSLLSFGKSKVKEKRVAMKIVHLYTLVYFFIHSILWRLYLDMSYCELLFSCRQFCFKAHFIFMKFYVYYTPCWRHSIHENTEARKMNEKDEQEEENESSRNMTFGDTISLHAFMKFLTVFFLLLILLKWRLLFMYLIFCLL